MIGTDIIDKRRIAVLWQKYGRRLAEKVLHPMEFEQFALQKDPVRFLAMRWAAKEALGKSLGIGVRAPLTMPAICITKNKFGAPIVVDTDVVCTIKKTQGIDNIHLSLSDERNYAVAFVWCEQKKSD
ncbi:MAG: holo-ACP synthase [Cardiobacteriaceae bacterium]|nr:holo-ACP synthase [Cardiobacteriaceae bacterium]